MSGSRRYGRRGPQRGETGEFEALIARTNKENRYKVWRSCVEVARKRIAAGKLAFHDALDDLREIAFNHDWFDLLMGQQKVEECLTLLNAPLDTSEVSAPDPNQPPGDAGVEIVDFYAYMPMHNYIYAPTRDAWPKGSLDSRLPPVQVIRKDGTAVLDNKGEQKTVPPSVWLDKYRPVEQMTWAPGLPMIIKDRLVDQAGWIERKGVSCFNRYRAPIVRFANPANADRWIDHVKRVFGEEDANHIIRWLAQRVQRPQEKINHALILGGKQGIGKDTILEPVKYAVGPWNFREIKPEQLLARFNGFLQSVILRVSEASDLGEMNRFQFYEHMKTYAAAPPDVLEIDEKHLRSYSILNCTGVIITTNYKTGGLYLPADDRRHFAAWSDLEREDFTKEYWNGIWGWYNDGGLNHVAAYLAQLDIADFDPKAPPRKTAAFWDIVSSNRPTEDAEFFDLLDMMANPPAVTLSNMLAAAGTDPDFASFVEWLRDPKHRRQIPNKLENCGYVSVQNNEANDGLWKINGKRQRVYAKRELTEQARQKAARTL